MKSRALRRSHHAIAIYDQRASELAELYESTVFEIVHASILDLLPARGSNILDVGAGSGRDAAALAACGYAVTAVEPARELQKEALRRHANVPIEWLCDTLPDLVSLSGRTFDFILISAVWMHIDPWDREHALRRLTTLLRHAGRLVITFRTGPGEPGRFMTPVNSDSMLAVSLGMGMRLIRTVEDYDKLQRPGVSWVAMAFEATAPR